MASTWDPHRTMLLRRRQRCQRCSRRGSRTLPRNASPTLCDLPWDRPRSLTYNVSPRELRSRKREVPSAGQALRSRDEN